ncbi:PorT family protein [Maribacter algarum]|uniref:PorT family protein n=1 Tax=Maribacter algarum (ex Zhang et al. 2020) TaxID=2578118 RepID=A0A5S3PU56_9FLAO|nr:PorT family protein [Maribacter algarum]TMM56220.1 PorT family protein [Maribacter algarum]
MKTITRYFLLLILTLMSQNLSAQEEQYQRKIEVLQNLKDDIVAQEKKALKEEVETINGQLENEDITAEQAKVLKEEAAKKHALNIENKVAIVDNKIALLKRNEDDVIAIEKTDQYDDDGMFKIDVNGERVVSINSKDWKKEIKYDRRTYVDPVIAVGFNNAIIEGQSLEDSPYKLGGSRFVELGWAWRTRVFKNSNSLRLSYGVSFQFNSLKPKNNQYFVVDEGETELQEFEFDLRKSKFRMDNLVFPVHFEFGPSKFSKTEKRIRYSIRNQFRLGIGGYGGFNIGSRQKLKYKNAEGRNVKDKLKGGYDTSSFVYGLSAYVGFDGVQLYAKYDLNPIFRNAAVEQRNISLGVRFDLD